MSKIFHHIRKRRWRRALPCFGLLLFSSAVLAQQPFDTEEFKARRAKLFDKIPDGVAVVFAAQSHMYPIRFRQSPDFFYLTGIEEPGALLLLIGHSSQAYLFAPTRSQRQIIMEGPGVLQVDDAAQTYGLTSVRGSEDFFGFLSFLVGESKKLYMPLSPPDNVQGSRGEMKMQAMSRWQDPIYRAEPEHQKVVESIQQWLPQLQLENLNPLLDDLRWVKTPYEIERMRRSGDIGARGVAQAIKGTEPGMYEYELEAAARFVFTKLGARGDAFTPIVASGPNTVIWHYAANNREMQAGEIVYMDYGCDFDYYTSDITRTWPVSGRFAVEEEKMYRCILDARNALIDAVEPGQTIAGLKDVAQSIYEKHGYGKEFQALRRYVGHFVGLSVHDVRPSQSNRPFEPGVVFNVEPILEFRDREIHLRLEDTILVTETGAENLTAGVPADLEKVYSLISQKGLSIN